MTSSAIPEDPHQLAGRLVRACRKEGLRADVLAPTRVRVSLPHAHPRLTEVIRIMPDENETLAFYWSWDERICPADDIDKAVNSIKHVVTPPAHSQF